MNISDNAYDVAITAIRNCTWKGTEIEKVQRALLEFERLHDHALTEQAKTDKEMAEVEKNIDAILEGKRPPYNTAPADAVSTKEVEPSKPTDLDVEA